MTTLIIGGGLIGLATAQALRDRGQSDIIIIEAREGVALETSFANAGIMTPSMSDPWNGPGVHWQLLASFFSARSPMKLRLHALPALVNWGLRFLHNSSPARHLRATELNFLLSDYSVRQTQRLRERLGLRYDCSDVGTLKIFRDASAMRQPLKLATHLASLGLRTQVLSRDETIAHEPALAPIASQLAGALRFADDAAGDAQQFCRALEQALRRADVELRCNVKVKALRVKDNRVRGVISDHGAIEAERVVVAAGCWSPQLLQPVGVSLPIKPAKGYSLTIDLHGVESRPRIPIVDDAMHAAVTPMGDRLRIGGTAEFAGFDARIDPKRIDNLKNLTRAIYPRLAEQIDFNQARAWTGLRPMSCDGVPFVGATRIDGLYVNAGHGHLGWTMAVGSGELLADQMLGRAPALDPAPFRVERD